MGLIKENGKQIFVGSGIGTSILPIRFMTPPEVSILKIYPQENNHENSTSSKPK
jgi:predicted MPP superfamily phosphohydrolase